MKSRNRRRLVILALLLALVPLVYALATRPGVSADVDRGCYLRAHDEPYWSLAYCREFATAPDNGFWVHLDHGRRYTVPVQKPVIYMLGNSTVWGTYVLDVDTLPSQLQALVGDTYRVENRGVPGLTVAGELDELYTIHLAPQDIVVMYDGLEVLTPRFIDTSTGEAAAYRRYLLEAQAYTQARGALWFHAIQPTIYSGTLRPDETALATATAKAFGLWRADQGWREAWPVLQAVNVGADFTHVLDGERAAGVVLFVDSGHVNRAGNAIIARALYNEISVY